MAHFPVGLLGVVEDFLRPINIDRRAFAAEMSGGWLFGQIAALAIIRDMTDKGVDP